jgi:drug/metabolite transporter (DMT)-like permease
VTAVAFGLLTALLFGIASYLGPVLSRSHSPSAVLAVGQCAAVLVAAVLLVSGGADLPGTHFVVLGLLAGIANGVALTAMFEAGRHLPISVMAPIGATGGIVPVVVALALGERPHLLQLAGIPLAIIGVVLVAAGPGGPSGMRTLGNVRPIGLWLAATWAICYGIFLSLFAVASAGHQSWAVLTSRAALLGTALALPALRGRSLRLPRRAIPLAAVNGLLILGGVVTFGVATGVGLVSVVSVLATLSPLITVAMAVVILRERLSRFQQGGLLAAVVGIVLLAAG